MIVVQKPQNVAPLSHISGFVTPGKFGPKKIVSRQNRPKLTMAINSPKCSQKSKNLSTVTSSMLMTWIVIVGAGKESRTPLMCLESTGNTDIRYPHYFMASSIQPTILLCSRLPNSFSPKLLKRRSSVPYGRVFLFTPDLFVLLSI